MRPRVVARAVLGLAVATSVVVAAAIALRTLAVRRAEEGPQAAAPAPREWARPEPAAMARRLAESLRFRTVSAEPGGERELAALQRHLLEVFPRAARELAPDSSGRGLVFTWPGTDPDRKPLLLLGHLDVVGEGAAGARAWARPPFAGVIDGGYVWGRGAIDDKGPSLAMLEAAEALLAEGFRPRRTIVIALGSDEEVGGTRGAAAIAKEMGSRGVRFGAAL